MTMCAAARWGDRWCSDRVMRCGDPDVKRQLHDARRLTVDGFLIWSTTGNPHENLWMSRLSGERRDVLLRRGLRLEYATLGWNVIAIGFLIAAAVTARSVALAGFAADSVIEIFASVVVVWQLNGTAHAHSEQRAIRLIGTAFFLLAVYLVAQAATTVALDVRPDTSPLGIGWLAATGVVMLGLAAGKARTGRELDHAVLSAEAKVTLVDAALAAAILVGLILNAAAGWWWADVSAGIVLAAYGLREGQHHIHSASTPDAGTP